MTDQSDDVRRPSFLRALAEPRCAAMAGLGFASGLPFAIINETSTARLAQLGVDRTTIGLLGAISSVYAFKFLWAGFVDARSVPWLAAFGRRRSWLIATNAVLVVLIALLAFFVPATKTDALMPFAAMLVAMSVLSATFDLAVNAWTIERFPRRELGVGSSLSVTGYRIALLVGGLVALSVATRFGWPQAFLVLAAMQSIGLVALLVDRDRGAGGDRTAESTPGLVEAFRAPIVDLVGRLGVGILLIVALVLVFRLPDQLATPMQKPLLLDTLGYEPEQFGVLRNGIGLAATILGSLAGGALVVRFGLVRAMLVACLAQAASNLGFAWIAVAVEPLGGVAQPWTSWPVVALGLVSILESGCGGLVGTVFVAFLMALCDRRFAALQYALLTSLMALSGGVASAASGFLAGAWPAFFIGTALAGLPGLVLAALAGRCATKRPAGDGRGPDDGG
jgi:PAT family beta-lactamase induction signal transducer AmpG